MSLRSAALLLKNIFYIFFSFIFVFNTLYAAAPICNPTSAVICAAVDDTADIYLNGTFIDTFPYCDSGAACTPKCVNLSGAQLALLTDSTNAIAVYNQNTNTDEIWASWSMVINCAAGPVYVSSAEMANINMLHDASCASPNPSPTPYSGRQWHDPLYNNPTGWVPPVIMTGQKWGKRTYDPQTGTLLPALSFAASYPSTGCGALWFRQPFTLTPEPTPVPPALTMTKSASPSTNVGQNTPYDVTFTLHICNTGSGTFGQPVTVTDDWTSSGGSSNWQYMGPYGYTDTVFGAIDVAVSGETMTLTFRDGFPDHRCYDFTYWVHYNSGSPPFCNNWDNKANLALLASPTVHATAAVSNYCPPPPSFTFVKSASKTTMTGNNENLTYTLRLCNSGGAAWSGSATIFDDMTSAPGDWQYDGPYYVGNPVTGIHHYDTSGGTKSRSYNIVFEQPGFTGCIDIPYYVRTSNNYGCGPWHNDATFSYLGSPTIVSTVPMLNFCSPTFTVTQTRTPTITPTITQTRTATPTITITLTRAMTYTITPTVTRTITATVTQTVTPTPPIPNIQLTKTEDKTIVMLGETIQYCLNYTNAGSQPATFSIWDTIPDPMDFVSCTGGCSQVGRIVVWNITALPAGNSGSVCFNARAARLPYFKTIEEFFAVLFDPRKNYTDCIIKD